MEKTVFTHKFRFNSEGRSLQTKIHNLEEQIQDAKKAALTLDIGGYHVRLTDEFEEEIIKYNVIYDILDLKQLVLKKLEKEIWRLILRRTDLLIRYENLIK